MTKSEFWKIISLNIDCCGDCPTDDKFCRKYRPEMEFDCFDILWKFYEYEVADDADNT